MTISKVYVSERFERAFYLSRFLPSAKAPGYTSSWSSIVDSGGGANPVLSPDDFRESDETNRWLQLLPDENARHIVIMKARKTPTYIMARKLGMATSTVNRQWGKSLQLIADIINTKTGK